MVRYTKHNSANIQYRAIATKQKLPGFTDYSCFEWFNNSAGRIKKRVVETRESLDSLPKTTHTSNYDSSSINKRYRPRSRMNFILVEPKTSNHNESNTVSRACLIENPLIDDLQQNNTTHATMSADPTQQATTLSICQAKTHPFIPMVFFKSPTNHGI